MDTDFLKIAGQLVGRPVEYLHPCQSGRNSRVYKAVSGSRVYALKNYPASDPRNRLETEVKALRYYETSHNPYAPRFVVSDIEHRLVLMDWIEGSPVLAPDASDMEQALDFISRTHAARPADDALFCQASEPCLCGIDLDKHINERLERLHTVFPQEPELKHFLEQELAPILEQARARASGTAFFSAPLSRTKQTLVPADFGFHNALRTGEGRIYFVDFEYFGWDDPVRLAADFLFHPGITLDEELKERFRQGMVEIFRADEEFSLRLIYLSPMYAIRWALILLNEFLPDRWRGRIFAGEQLSWNEIKSRQLIKAGAALEMAKSLLSAP